MWLYHRVMSPNDADGMANSVDPDQTAPLWDCTVCLGISVRKFRINTVPVFPLTRPTLCFCADPAIFIAFQKKIKRFSYLPILKCFRKLDKYLKMSELQN